MNENIKKFYKHELAILEMNKERLLEVFKTEQQLNLALNIFRTRYTLHTQESYSQRSQWDREILQAETTSNKCLKVVFGKVINEEVIDYLKLYDCLLDHVDTLKEFINDDTAVLIRDYYTVGMDNVDCITIGYIISDKDGKHANFWMLTDDYQETCYGIDGNPMEEKKEKAINYWKQNGML